VIRILLAEDQRMVRGALAALLAFEPDLEVVAQASSGNEALTAAAETRPDVALLDIEMPEIDGIDVAARLRRELPECTILILTTFGRPAYLRRAMEAGASGFLVKDAPAERLANAIRRAVTGERIVDPELAAAALQDRESPLTQRERDVLDAGAGGSPVSEIARRLHLSEGTVRNYVSTAIGKTGARNRTEAWRIARERGWL
jgi:two-component system response regulator DesR